ncbi:MAG: DUF1189 domain-containing protein [Bacillota bacterium]
MDQPLNLVGQVTASVTGKYRDLHKLSTGKAFLYLFLFTIVFGGIGLIRPMIFLKNGIEKIKSWYGTNVPEFFLEKGELTVDAEMPIQYKQDDVLIMIDTSGKTDPSILEGYKQGFWIGKDRFVTKQNSFEKREYSYKEMGPLRLDKKTVQEWLPFLNYFLYAFAFFAMIFYFVGQMISAWLVAIAASLFGRPAGLKITFGEIYKLGIFALTLPMIIRCAVDLSGVEVPSFYLIYLGVGIFHMITGLRSLVSEAPPAENNPAAGTQI